MYLARFLLLSLLAMPLAGMAAVSEEDPWIMLEKAGQAAHKLNYRGVFVYQCGRSISSTQITHMNFQQGEFARLVSLDGAPREVLRQGNEVVVFNQSNEKVTIEKRLVQNAFPAILPGLPATLKASYHARYAGEERVGGRDGVIIQLEPRDGYRYGYRFTVDREFGLLLKSVMLDEGRKPIEQVAFNQLSLMSAEGLDWFRPQVDVGKTYVMQPEETVTPAVDESGWVVAQLPPGFRKMHQVKRNVPGKSVPVHHLIFSDGMASVSLFVEAYDRNRPAALGYARHGATNINVTVMDGHQVVVVGEVPEATVKQIAAAVSFKK
jgi:sigma-E factor negative regulatory protein RseB